MANLDQNAHYSVFIHIFPTLSYSYLIPRRTSRTTTTGWEWRSSEFSLSRQSAVSTSGSSWRSDQNLKYVDGKPHLNSIILAEMPVWKLWYQVRQRRRRRGREERLTLVLIAIVTTFLICSLPRFDIGGWNPSSQPRFPPLHRCLSQDDPQSARDVHPRLDPPMSRILTWRIPSLEHCAWICLPRSFGHRQHIKSIDQHGQLVIICQNNHQCRHTLVSTFVLGFASHVLLADITIFIMMLIFFTWAYFFSSKVVNSSANLFIYCAIGARYSSNAFCVKNFMSASLITLSNNHIFQKSYTMWTSYRDGHYSVAHNTPDNHSVNADSEPNAGSTFVVAGTLLDANAPRPPLRWELCCL